MIIAIDGPAGSGKSSTAKSVALRLGILYLDTGAMYRAVTLKALREGIAAADVARLEKLLSNTEISFTGVPPDVRVYLDREDVSMAIRGDEVTRQVSDYCAPAIVRTRLVAWQREIAGTQSVVCEGRDIGTAVFPQAELKFFMSATAQARARRRQLDFRDLGIAKTIEELVDEISERDRKDSTRALNPLRKAPDAVEIDTTEKTLPEQIDIIVNKALEKGFDPAGRV
jgi:cytidylate kinase